MDLKNKIVSVIGLGKTGVATANFLARRGSKVSIMDNKTCDQLSELTSQLLPGIEAIYQNSEPLPNSDLIVISPSVDIESDFLKSSRQKGTEIISEIELASRLNSAFLIGITGTNGKTTTTLLTYEILKNAGLNVGIAGNIGKSFARQVAQEEFDYYVLEISSFQLDNIKNFAPHIAVITNITPDHLNRYNDSLEEYIKAKLKITQNQSNVSGMKKAFY